MVFVYREEDKMWGKSNLMILCKRDSGWFRSAIGCEEIKPHVSCQE